MGAATALEALGSFPDSLQEPVYQDLLQNFKFHAGNLSLYQSKSDGKWHNLIKDPTTYLETSSTSMYLFSILKGLEYDWLDRNIYLPIAQKAWSGLKDSIDFDGTIFDIVGETGIKDDPEGYDESSRDYAKSAPGLGAVLRAVASVIKFDLE